jgi:hypothetical protein
MTILQAAYNPLATRVAFVVVAALLILATLFYQIHSRRLRKNRVTRSESPAAESRRFSTAGQPAHEMAPWLHSSMQPGSSPLGDIARIALILLAMFVAAGLTIVVLPQNALDRMVNTLRLRHPETLPQERISLLYLGDETKSGEFHIRGTIRNISVDPIEKVDATVRLYASDGSLLETLVIRMDSEQIAPDAISSFHLTYPDYKGQFSSYAVDFKLRQGDPLPYKDMRQS